MRIVDVEFERHRIARRDRIGVEGLRKCERLGDGQPGTRARDGGIDGRIRWRRIDLEAEVARDVVVRARRRARGYLKGDVEAAGRAGLEIAARENQVVSARIQARPRSADIGLGQARRHQSRKHASQVVGEEHVGRPIGRAGVGDGETERDFLVGEPRLLDERFVEHDVRHLEVRDGRLANDDLIGDEGGDLRRGVAVAGRGRVAGDRDGDVEGAGFVGREDAAGKRHDRCAAQARACTTQVALRQVDGHQAWNHQLEVIEEFDACGILRGILPVGELELERDLIAGCRSQLGE